MLSFIGVRTLFATLSLIAGAIIFAGDPAQFTWFSFCAIPGTTALAGTLLAIGLTLWRTR